MTFRWPAALLALALVPVGALVLTALRSRRARFAVSFTNLEVLSTALPAIRRWPQRVAGALFVTALVAIVVGAARPQARVPTPREDATVVLVMDTSGSMVSTDVAPNRLDAAKAAARSFVDVVPERLRVGVVGFATVADVLAWPTTDRELVRGALREIRATGATAIGDGLMKALDMTGPVDGADERLFAVLLLSDGRNNAGRAKPHEAAALARELEIPVFTVALGTAPDRAPGQVPGVVEPVDTGTLRSIAERTGGAFFSAADEQTLNAIYTDLGSRIGYEDREQEITFAFAGGAAVLLCGATLASMFRRPARPDFALVPLSTPIVAQRNGSVASCVCCI